MNENVIVSVCMITYNHELYINQAIEGIMVQKTNFQIELVIGEDCSTDNTRKICLEYKEKYPDKINLLLPVKNLGMIPNFVNTLNACTGKYIAICEGDDYWTDPLKLQKQVDFLEENEDFSVCFHAVKIEKDKKIVDDFITPEVSDITDIYSLAHGNYIHTPSVVFRKNEEVMKTMDAWRDLSLGDYPLHMLNAQYGKIKKLPETMAIYRVGVGVWSIKDSSYRLPRWLKMLDKLIELLKDDEKLTNILKQQYRVYAFALYDIYVSEKEISKAQTLFTTMCVCYPGLVYEEFINRDSALYFFKKSSIYRTGVFLLKPFLVLRKLIKNHKKGK